MEPLDSQAVVSVSAANLNSSAPLERDVFWNAPPRVFTPVTADGHPAWRAAHAALASEGQQEGEVALLKTWEELASGRLTLALERTTGDRSEIIARVHSPARPLAPIEVCIAQRVLRGEQQKFIATELKVAPSTVSGRFIGACSKLGLVERVIPLPLVLAALTQSAIARVPRARRALFEYEDEFWVIVSVPRGATDIFVALTEAEREVAQAFIEGRSRWEIARLRSTSPHTVSRQCSSIFCTLGASGRYALIRRAAELLCFR